MDDKAYLRESARTAAGTFHTDKVNPPEFDFMLKAVVAAGSWADRLKRSLFYGQEPDKKSPDRWSTTSIDLTADRVSADVVHAMLGCITEASEIAEHVLAVLKGEKPLDRTNLIEELGDLTWYIALGLRAVDSDFDTAFDLNIAKLKARFPDKFTEEQAVTRDLNAERAALEPSAAAPTVSSAHGRIDVTQDE
jgi:NTP pyrophosphatase (non-canonical NTP hydrolase)